MFLHFIHGAWGVRALGRLDGHRLRHGSNHRGVGQGAFRASTSTTIRTPQTPSAPCPRTTTRPSTVWHARQRGFNHQRHEWSAKRPTPSAPPPVAATRHRQHDDAGVHDEHSGLFFLLGHQRTRWLVAASGAGGMEPSLQESARIVLFCLFATTPFVARAVGTLRPRKRHAAHADASELKIEILNGIP